MSYLPTYVSDFDPRFKITRIASTSFPQSTAWLCLHQCYSEGDCFTGAMPKTETEAGEAVVKHLLAGNRGHYSPLEHNAITFNVVGFPHSVMQQLRTHRVGVSFSVQSGRYTGKRITDAATFFHEEWGTDRDSCLRIAEDVGYLRPIGCYTDRSGKSYEYTETMRSRDLMELLDAIVNYQERIAEGYSEEHARGLFPFDFRQNFVVSFNARSLMHILDLRYKKDAQLEIQELSKLLLQAFQEWMPEVAQWYLDNRAMKARLAP